MIYLDLFLTFFKIGAFTFGGGYAMLPLIQYEVLEHGWITSEALVDFIAVSESTPGPFAVNISTYVGMTVAGFAGAICSTLGVILPSFIIILIIAKVYEGFKNSKIVKGAMSGLKPTVIGLIGAAAVSVGMSAFFPSHTLSGFALDTTFYISLTIAVIMIVLAFRKIHPILIIIGSAVLGIVSSYLLI